MIDVIDQFRSAMLAAGITPPSNILVDGKKYRFSTNGKSNDTAGEYRIYPDEISAGYFKDYRSGVYVTWTHNLGRKYTAEESRRANKAAEKRRLEEEVGHAKAAEEAQRIWDEAQRVPENFAYCKKQQIHPIDAKLYDNSIIVRALKNKKIVAVQRIYEDGSKLFWPPGCAIRGGYLPLPGKNNHILLFVEGYATGVTTSAATGYTTVITFAWHNMPVVAVELRKKFPDSLFAYCCDDDFLNKDNPGVKGANLALDVAGGIIIKPEFDTPRPSDATDLNDVAKLYGIERVKAIITEACLKAHAEVSPVSPIPLPTALPPVRKFVPEMLPKVLSDFVMDVSHRQQSPADFVAVTALCALSAVLGRKIQVHPKQNDDWTITPNLWGALIGRPSAMKSPCMKAALRPLYYLQDQFSKQFAQEKINHEVESELNDILRKANKDAAKDKIKIKDTEGALKELKKNAGAIPPPIRKRLIINNASVEKLGELLNENPNGLLLSRDELFGWLSDMQKEEFQGDRAFYLECFDGDSKFIYDRIGRGTIEIASCILSVIGGIQPSRLMPMIHKVMKGVSDDGLMQRLQLAVYPEDNPNWSWQDQAPDSKAYYKYQQIFIDFHNIHTGDMVVPEYLRFSQHAQPLIIEWMEELNTIARSKDIPPSFESYLLKLPKTIVSLALIFELVEGERQSIDIKATAMALEWADYLIDHAKRIYNRCINPGMAGAHLLIERKDKLPKMFTARDVYIKNWSSLGDVDSAKESIQCLIDHGYLEAQATGKSDVGGHPTIIYKWTV